MCVDAYRGLRNTGRVRRRRGRYDGTTAYSYSVAYDLRLVSTGSKSVCGDGLSNDFDGLVDWPVDPGGSSAADTSETGSNACENGVDDDADGAFDWPSDNSCPDALGVTEAAVSWCPAPGTTVDVTLPRVKTEAVTRLKPFRIIYDELPLTFTRVPLAGSRCAFESTRGSLPVLMDFRGMDPYLLATSTTSARVDFLSYADVPECDLKRLEFGRALERNCTWATNLQRIG